ncbi:MAG: hypothetical protein M1829_006941 [Trizodia sp. TS-e1964]|nr:MAG: hypothetical protein M1829_006941 [Trizodia sp. TS-e1964]
MQILDPKSICSLDFLMDSSKIFSLEGLGLKLETAADVESHIKDLRNNNLVEEVRLGGNTLGIEACKAIAEVLAHKNTLKLTDRESKTANLADIFTSRLLAEIPQALTFLLTALLSLPQLETIDLSDNAFGLNTQAPLVEFLSAHVPLRHLILNNNGLGPSAGVLIADALTALHAKKEAARAQGKDVPYLETVICGRNRLENGSMAAWAEVFARHDRVQVVKMVQNGIRQEGISHLLRQGLKHASTLRDLDLQDNTFTKVGSVALSEVVIGWKSLRELGVGDCLLSARGGMVLAEALGKGENKALEILRLQFNDIDISGLNKLENSVKNAMPELRRIELNGNRFSEEEPSLESLRELLQERKVKAGVVVTHDNQWGLDSLSDLEEDSDEDEEGDDDDDSTGDGDGDTDEEDELVVSANVELPVSETPKQETQKMAQENNDQIDTLVDQLEKTTI